MLPVERTKKLGPSKLKPALDRRLISYVAVASAAGVTTLALAQPAVAEIVYTPANINIGNYYALDLNHDGIADFTIRIMPYMSHTNDLVLQLNAPGNAAEDRANPLGIGVLIGAERKFTTNTFVYGGIVMGDFFAYASYHNSNGAWKNVTNKFLGLRFMVDGETHYGWARLSFTGAISAVLTGYAYETVPNQKIRAGQRTESEDTASFVPPQESPSSKVSALGLLASGVNGLAIWRREEAELL
jgi:hypothetical protein